MKLNEQDLAPFLAVNARDAVAITLTPIKETDTSFCGGHPTLPVTLDWPCDPNGNECIFLAQINLAELEILPESWPASGHLFVFLNAVLESTGETATDAPFLYYASADQVVERRAPASPIHAESYFWYEGDGFAGMGRSRMTISCVCQNSVKSHLTTGALSLLIRLLPCARHGGGDLSVMLKRKVRRIPALRTGLMQPW